LVLFFFVIGIIVYINSIVFISSMKKHLLLIVLLLLYKFSAAQQAGEVDLNFNPNDKGYGVGLNNYALVSGTQSDGKILIAGGLSSFKDHRANGILRLNADGTYDKSFVVDTLISNNDKTIYSLNILPNNKIIIAGKVIDYQGSGRNYLLRLFPDGSIDTSFNPSSISNTAIYTAILPDGKILVAHLDGKRLSKLNENGSLDTSFNIGSGANDYVSMISIASDNGIILTGYFDEFNGQPCYGVIKLLPNGNIDQNFITEKINNFHDVHYVDPSGNIYIAGNFDSVANHKRNGIARLNSNGSLDLSYNPGQYLPISNGINSIAGQSDGKIYFAGAFDFTSSQRSILVRVNIDGTLDTSFTSYLTGLTQNAYHVAITNQNKLILSGSFYKYNNKGLGHYVRLLQDGTIDYAFHKETGVGGTVRSIEKYGPNKILIAGDFGSYNGNDSIQNIALINENGEADLSFKADVNGTILNTLPLANGKIIIVGEFKKVNNQVKNGIARLNANGSLDPTFNMNGTGSDGIIQHILKLKNNSFYLLGQYKFYNGSSVRGIIRISENGTLDSNFRMKEHGGLIRAMAIDSVENLYVAGVSVYNFIDCKPLIRLNPNAELDTLFDQNQSAVLSNASYRKLIVLDNQKLLTVGPKNNSSPGVYLFNFNGTSNQEFNSNVTLVGNSTFNNIIKVQNNGFLISGNFIKYNTITRNNIVRIFNNGTLDTSFNAGNSTPQLLYALYMDNNSNYLMGGSFSLFNNVGRNSLCRVYGSSKAFGIDDQYEETFSDLLFPNPSTNKLHVKNPTVEKYIIYNQLGQLMQQGNVSTKEEINISKLSNAAYIMELIDVNDRHTYHRFIKE
jgi:uncharacterized delta-60 repeat protein